MREWRGASHYQQSLKGGMTTVNCLRTDKLLVKRGGWGGGGLKIHKIKEPYGGCKI